MMVILLAETTGATTTAQTCTAGYQNETGSDGIGDTSYGIYRTNQDRYPLMKPYRWDLHDIGITNTATSKTIVGQGYNLHINITIFNYGNNTGTFNVTVYFNETAITLPDGKNHTTTTLTSGNSTTITYTWNAAGWDKGNYTMTAEATPIPGETGTTDNIHIDGWVIVAMVGDINADGKVNIINVATVARAFESRLITDPEDPKYGEDWHAKPCTLSSHPPEADINNDGKINILDVATTARQFGKIDP